MAEDIFNSSDSLRGLTPLPHAQYVTLAQPVELVGGGRLERVRIAYETYGHLNERRDNAVLICHALSGDSHVAAHDANDAAGWWDIAVGPGKAIDTDEYFVICPNILGGCRGTTGPNGPNPATEGPYGPDFPAIEIADIVNVQARLLDELGIQTLLAAIGGSMGGMQVLQWSIGHPRRIRCAVVLASAATAGIQALAFDVIGRNAITHDPNFRGGRYYEEGGVSPDGVFAPAVGVGGLAIARMIGHMTYLSREAMRDKFGGEHRTARPVRSQFEKDSSVASYLAHQGDKFVERFDANSYLAITRAMDRFDLGQGKALQKSLAAATARFLIVSFSSDWLFPPEQSQEIVEALVASALPVSYCNVTSNCGHDAFLLKDELDVYGGLVAGFLAQGGNGHSSGDQEVDAQGQVAHPDTSIFHGRRLDYDFLEQLLGEEFPVANTAEGGCATRSVLDLGCGFGQMLLRLKSKHWRRLVGVEIDERAVLECVRRGVDCIHADLNEGLDIFEDKSFDCVLLSRTLQAVKNVDGLVNEMLRVGRRCVVSFPNFAFRPLREMLHFLGRAPEAPGLLRYKWYDSPNIRFFSIADFEEYCREKGATIHRRVALNTESRLEVTEEPNLNADLAIFVISKG